MAACGRLLVVALLVAVAFVPAAVTATRLLQRFGDDDFFDTDTEDKAFGSRNDDLHANHTHGKQSPHAGGYKAGDSNSDDRWDTTQQKPATHDNSRGSNGDDNQPAEQQPSWSSPTKDQDSAPKSTPRKTSSRRRSDGGDSGSENTPQDSGSSPSTPKDTEATPADSTKGSSGTLSDPELQKALDVHNSLRAKHGASPLVWSTQLATQAQNWAKGCSHSHSIKDDNWIYGESIQWGVPNFEAAIMEWYSEVSKYHGQPQCYSDETAHFSQIVWKATKNLGCGYSSCPDKMKFYVCQYTPGNGEQGSCQQNVQA